MLKTKTFDFLFFHPVFHSKCCFFEVRSLLQITITYKFKSFTTTKYFWCQMLKSRINCNDITVTVVSWLVK